MPKFKVIKNGTNEELIKSVTQKVDGYVNQIFEGEELIKLDDLYTFDFGDVAVNIRVLPWHSEDVLVEVFSYVSEGAEMNADIAFELLRLNQTLHFGGFSLTYDQSVVFSYSLAGANLDMNELLAAVQTVATVSDQYCGPIKEGTLAAEEV